MKRARRAHATRPRRGLGALALGAINPALALVPLIEANTADDSECRKLIAEAKAATQ